MFGFYLKLTRGAICNAGIASDESIADGPFTPSEMPQVADIFCQEFVVGLVESLMSEIEFCVREKILGADTYALDVLARDVAALMAAGKDSAVTDFGMLRFHLAKTRTAVAEFVRRRFIYRENVAVPVATLDLQLFKDVLTQVRQKIKPLAGTTFVILLDEYENLFPFQQKVVNGFVKLGAPDFSVKIAKKMGGDDTSGTSVGQDLQQIHDYTLIPLVYEVGDSARFAAYRRLLAAMIQKILENERYTFATMAQLLPQHDDPEVEEAKLLEEVASLDFHALANGCFESIGFVD